VKQIGARNFAETRHVHVAGEQTAIDIGERISPSGQPYALSILNFRVHGAEQNSDDLVGVGGVLRAHLRDDIGKQALPDEDVGVLGEKAKDEPRHEVIHVVAALGPAPLGVVLQQLDIKPVQAAGRPDVE
jgi:hypothetical protein